MPKAGSSTSKLLSSELLCVFCNEYEDEKRYGKLISNDGIAAHNFCLLFSSGLAQKGEDNEGLDGFLIEDILKECKRCNKLKCSFCKVKGGSIGCGNSWCKKSYHYGCGKDNGAMFTYHGNYSSYCKKHSLVQEELPAEERKTLKPVDTCYICYENLNTTISPTTILAPCCTRAWYHRQCIEDMAYSAGLHYFKCPLCNNVDEWQAEMLRIGIYIPDRDASWELVPGAYNSLLQPNLECVADVCICPQGRSEDETDGEWELIMCETCGCQAVHTQCGKLKKKDKEWLCSMCRGTTSGSSKENEVPHEPETLRSENKRQSSSSNSVPPKKTRPSKSRSKKKALAKGVKTLDNYFTVTKQSSTGLTVSSDSQFNARFQVVPDVP